MPAAAIPLVAAGVGAVGSAYAADKQNDASQEAAEASRDLPEWLKPYYIGTDEGPQLGTPPINYNWLDAINMIGQTGMPSPIPPMSMNNPSMTMEGVHTPTEGGPWGYGMGPGVPTTQLGVPTAPGAQFVPQQPGFAPGPTGPAAPPGDPAAQGGMSPEAMAMAQQYAQMAGLWNSTGDGFQRQPSSLDALQWAGNNPGASERDVIRAGLLAPYGYGQG